MEPTHSSMGSVTRWIGDLKEGDSEAASQLWRRYFASLVTLARKRMEGRRRSAASDEEDAALSAFHSLCRGAAQGHFDQLSDRDDLWRLLVVLTTRKALDQQNRERRLKRGGGRVLHEAELGKGMDDPGLAIGLDRIVGSEPTPEFAALVAEEYARRLDALDAPLREIALWRLEGYGNDEIAVRLGCSTRTVERKLDLIRRTWKEDFT
ncbi:ECF-type sigma factor [Tautonia rosea]|uniref:ECF-type sigma factor n=1 Tax=Tautonia rosea TaxID=2728037 RepID=UPI001F172D0B|nr:ECF-type sigma factor [Tautonia rosea]